MSEVKSMFEMLKKIKKSADEYNNIVSKNIYMTNPFNQTGNKTFVWTEKSMIFEKRIKK